MRIQSKFSSFLFIYQKPQPFGLLGRMGIQSSVKLTRAPHNHELSNENIKKLYHKFIIGHKTRPSYWLVYLVQMHLGRWAVILVEGGPQISERFSPHICI